MRFLHTADWHLGQTLLGQSRLPEQRLALDWLYELAVEQEVDAIIVAGDVFDVASPAEDARKLYYDFLARLAKSPVKHVVVVAGNHDSPRMLNAVRSWAKAFDIHIVGQASGHGNLADDVIALRHPESQDVVALVAAVPFLQERDVRSSRAGQTMAEKEQALADGVHDHFDRIAAHCCEHTSGVPIIATGHLYAAQASARDGQDNIYVGKLRNLSAARLPETFDYVALGHIHRPQALAGTEHVRYSGSLIALDFQETKDTKGCWCVDVEYGSPADVRWHASPVSRRLKQLSGTYEEVLASLAAFVDSHRGDQLPPWLELELTDGLADSKRRARLREVAEEAGAAVLKIVRRRTSGGSALVAAPEMPSLEEVSVEEVFARRCQDASLDGKDTERVDRLFGQVLADVRRGQITTPA